MSSLEAFRGPLLLRRATGYAPFKLQPVTRSVCLPLAPNHARARQSLRHGILPLFQHRRNSTEARKLAHDLSIQASSNSSSALISSRAASESDHESTSPSLSDEQGRSTLTGEKTGESQDDVSEEASSSSRGQSAGEKYPPHKTQNQETSTPQTQNSSSVAPQPQTTEPRRRPTTWRQRRKPLLREETQSSTALGGQEHPRENPKEQERVGEKVAQSQEEKEEQEGGEEEEELEPGFKMTRVCDRLIEVFWIEKPTPEDWRKLLAYSEEWSKLRPHFFKTCERRAKEMEAENPGKAAELFKLARRLKEVDESMTQHGALLDLIIENEEELDGIVGRRRKDFTNEFFEFLRMKCEGSFRDIGKQEVLVSLANKILTAVETHDRLMQDEAGVEAAQTKFDDIMNSGTLEEACNKIDSLAERQQLDSTLMLMITKAWAASKESNMMKDEVKDVMQHLYMQALANMRMMVPKEVRILRHILSLEDPREMFAALTSAFSPGDEIEIQNASEDYLYTTPDKLLAVVDQVLTAYYSNRENTLIEEAKKLMNPAVIKQLEILKKVIIDEFK